MKCPDLSTRLLESVPFGLIVIQGDGSVAYANARLLEKIGFGDGDWDDLANRLPEIFALARQALDGGPAPVRQRVTLNNRAMLAEITRLPDWDAAACCLLPWTRVESSHESFYQSLQSQELNAIFNLSSDGIMLCDGSGQVVKINEASERLNGWTAKEVVGRNVSDLVRDRLIDKSVTLKVFESQKPVHMMQYIGRTKKHLLVTGTPLFGQDGRIKLVVVNERDMTQLNATKKQLEETQEVSEKYRDNLAELAALKSNEGLVKGSSQVMVQVLQYAVKLARLEASNILVTGESGVGKGLMAKFIHQQSPRQFKPFIHINCAALPESLLEAELFGYEKGAFTGAGSRGKAGLFELAHSGALFLDEIGDCPPAIQSKLLKYLDDNEVLRLGAIRPRIIDCTIIAATNRDLSPLIQSRQFRADLFYRLNTFNIHIPPLRERPEDTFELIMHFLDVFNNRYGLKTKISMNALRRLQGYSFPGNVRELRNIIKQAVVMSESDVLDDFILGGLSDPGREVVQAPAPAAPDLTLNERMVRYEREELKRALSRSGTTRELARLLGTSQPTVVRRLKKYGLPLPSKQK